MVCFFNITYWKEGIWEKKKKKYNFKYKPESSDFALRMFLTTQNIDFIDGRNVV